MALANLDRLSDLFSIASKVVSGRGGKTPLMKKKGMNMGGNKPLPLKQLGKGGNTPGKFTTLDELENFLKTTNKCELEKANL